MNYRDVPKLFVSLLKADPTLSAKVKNRIIPVWAESNIAPPYILYARAGVEFEMAKQLRTGGVVSYSFVIASTDYIESDLIAEKVEEIMIKGLSKQQGIISVRQTTSDESRSEQGVYVQEMSFNVKI